jgi:hypothetical protein
MFYNVKVQFTVDTGKKLMKKNEQYLVKAVSISDAEATVVKVLSEGGTNDFDVISASESKIVKVISDSK